MKLGFGKEIIRPKLYRFAIRLDFGIGSPVIDVSLRKALIINFSWVCRINSEV